MPTFVDQETPAIAVGSLAQIVYTLTQFDRIQGVVFEVDGSPLTNFGGYEIDGAQRRANFADQLPFILVQTPGSGSASRAPCTSAGRPTCSRPSSRSRSSTSTGR